MQTLLIILVVLAAGATLFVLVKGVIGMANGRDITGARSQELMRKRVMFQAVAIIFAIAPVRGAAADDGQAQRLYTKTATRAKPAWPTAPHAKDHPRAGPSATSRGQFRVALRRPCRQTCRMLRGSRRMVRSRCRPRDAGADSAPSR